MASASPPANAAPTKISGRWAKASGSRGAPAVERRLARGGESGPPSGSATWSGVAAWVGSLRAAAASAR